MLVECCCNVAALYGPDSFQWCVVHLHMLSALLQPLADCATVRAKPPLAPYRLTRYDEGSVCGVNNVSTTVQVARVFLVTQCWMLSAMQTLHAVRAQSSAEVAAWCAFSPQLLCLTEWNKNFHLDACPHPA